MPKLRLAFPVGGVFFASVTLAGPLELRVLSMDGNGVGGTVIVLRSTDSARPLAKPVSESMNQIRLQFVPHVLVVPTGSKVTFPNKDTVQHQVYSFSLARKFELPLYKGTPKPIDFNTAGFVTVSCNIHDNMHAYIFVVDAQYFGRADAGGVWKSADVQPGTYNVQVWHPLARNMRPVLEQKITVPATETKIALQIATPLKLRPASQIPANWDAY